LSKTGTPELCHVPAATQNLHLRKDELLSCQETSKMKATTFGIDRMLDGSFPWYSDMYNRNPNI
jgi:hypothetical protein